jgi:hypothetical protein
VVHNRAGAEREVPFDLLVEGAQEREQVAAIEGSVGALYRLQ